MPKNYGPLLRFLHSSVDREINLALEKMELTSAQGHILGYLYRQETPPCPKDIEQAFHLSHPTVSGLLSRMEKKGFLVLMPDGTDRRCKRIHILQKGSECVKLIYETIVETETRMVSGFSQQEQALLRSLLERAVDNLGGRPKYPKEEDNS